MTWSGPTTLASGTGSTAAISQTLSGITASAGTFVVVVGAFVVPSTVTGFSFSDSAGNSWTVHSQEIDNAAGEGYGFVAYSILTNALSSGSVTITRAGTGNISAWCLGAISFAGNAASSPEDGAVLATGFGSSASPSVTGNAATQSGDLLIAVCAVRESVTTNYTEDTTDGWTNIFNALTPSSGILFMSAAYQVNSGSSGVKHNPTLSTSRLWAEIQIGFSSSTASIALAALGGGQAKGGASFSAATAVAARGSSAARGSAASSSSAAISAGARGSASASARASLFAKAALSARGMAEALSRSVTAVSAALFGRGAAAARDSSKVSASAPVVGDPELLLKAPAVTRLMKAAAMIRSLKVP